MAGSVTEALDQAKARQPQVRAQGHAKAVEKIREAHAEDMTDSNQPDALEFWCALGKSLRLRREAMGLTVAEMGHVLGIAYQTMGALERGEKRRFSMVRLSKALHVLGVDITQHYAHLDVDDHKAKLDAMWQKKAGSIDDELKQAEDLVRSLRDRKALGTKIVGQSKGLT